MTESAEILTNLLPTSSSRQTAEGLGDTDSWAPRTVLLVHQTGDQAAVLFGDIERLIGDRSQLITVPHFHSVAGFYEHLATKLAAPTGRHLDSEMLARSVTAKLDVLRGANRRVILAIPDADFIDHTIISAAMTLAQYSGVLLVLWGDWNGDRWAMNSAAGRDLDIVEVPIHPLLDAEKSPSDLAPTTKRPNRTKSESAHASPNRQIPAKSEYPNRRLWIGIAAIIAIALILIVGNREPKSGEEATSPLIPVPESALPKPEPVVLGAEPQQGLASRTSETPSPEPEVSVPAPSSEQQETEISKEPELEPKPIATTDLYTIQLAAFSSVANRDRFLARRPGDENLRAIKQSTTGSDLFIITYGQYASMGEASRAINDVPPELVDGRPQPRKIELDASD